MNNETQTDLEKSAYKQFMDKYKDKPQLQEAAMNAYAERKPSLFIRVDSEAIENILLDMGLSAYDPILYLGGRVDDDNLYPTEYAKYLNQKIKELNPKKIICHSHWYAWKYYEKGILDDSMQIDLIVCNYGYLNTNTFDPINKNDYKGDHLWCIKSLVEKNPNMIFAAYQNAGDGQTPPSSADFYMRCFKDVKSYRISNLKYFTFDRRYNPLELTDKDLGHGSHTRNSTDGFGVLTNILKSGFKKVNIAGFTAFGSDEDDSNFSEYTTSHDKRVVNRNYFNIQTSEDQRAEADVLKHWTETRYINNLECLTKLNN